MFFQTTTKYFPGLKKGRCPRVDEVGFCLVMGTRDLLQCSHRQEKRPNPQTDEEQVPGGCCAECGLPRACRLMPLSWFDWLLFSHVAVVKSQCILQLSALGRNGKCVTETGFANPASSSCNSLSTFSFLFYCIF